MKLRAKIKSPLFVTVMLLLLVTAAICVFSFSCAGAELDFSACYYYVCYKSADTALSASSISSAVESYGGAGYIVECDGKYYVTIACYYSEKDAESVCGNLARRGIDGEIIKAERKEYRLPNVKSKKRAELYRGNLRTLNTLSRLAYDCANNIESGEYAQNKAKSVISSISDGLDGLKSQNRGNCFYDGLDKLSAECSNASSGFVYARDLRALQIAVCDFIINIELY